MNNARPTKVIIVAAGRGQRLMPHTEKVPKCLVPIGGTPMLQRQIETFLDHEIREFVVITGYQAAPLKEFCRTLAKDLDCVIHVVHNMDYQSNNVLLSLFFAQHHLIGNIAISYGDIIYTSSVVERLIRAPGDICLIVDRAFQNAYVGRTDHPLTEAELATVTTDGYIDKIGKRAVTPETAWGEYIGLSKLSTTGTDCVKDVWKQLETTYSGRTEHPFQRADQFRNAYLTDLWQYLIDHRLTKLFPIEIHGSWREIDTAQDLKRAEALLGCGQKEWK